jgi:hypothetical protein
MLNSGGRPREPDDSRLGEWTILDVATDAYERAQCRHSSLMPIIPCQG